MMKLYWYGIAALLWVTAACGWSVDQRLNFEPETHQTLNTLGEVFERSTNTLSQAINIVSEKGISSLPLNIDADVWYQIRHIIMTIALLSLSWVVIFWGLLGIRKRIIFSHTYESWNTFFSDMLATSVCTLAGFALMILSNYLARLILLL